MRTFNDTILDGYADETFETDAYSLKNIAGYSVTLNFSDGDAVGTVKLQVSNDKAENGAEPETWVDLTAPTTSVKAIDASNAATNPVVWNVTTAFYKWVRLVYTRTSGESNCKVTINAKGF